jgi:hypothetical protein
MYTLEVRSGVLVGDTRMHTFIYIVGPDGEAEAYGYYPADSWNGSGVIQDDLKTQYNATSGPVNITDGWYEKLKSYVKNSQSNQRRLFLW